MLNAQLFNYLVLAACGKVARAQAVVALWSGSRVSRSHELRGIEGINCVWVDHLDFADDFGQVFGALLRPPANVLFSFGD